MDGLRKIDSRPATQEEKAELLAFMRGDLSDDVGVIMRFLGITWSEFERLYASRGEVRAIMADGVSVGYWWIEHRERELHLHAIFVLPSHRGRGIGTAALRGLQREFRGKADVSELGVQESNERARSLYAREGFTTASRLAEIGFLVMRKQVRGEPTE
jgi:ribosomal protein S18 acetylase RimI-like enzyme